MTQRTSDQYDCKVHGLGQCVCMGARYWMDRALAQHPPSKELSPLQLVAANLHVPRYQRIVLGAETEIERLRETNQRLNRRCQELESELNRWNVERLELLRLRKMTADETAAVADSPCRCPRDSWGRVQCEERSGPPNTYCVAEHERA